MNIEQIRVELQDVDKACMALRATGGRRFRERFRATDTQLQRYAAAVPMAFKRTMIHMLAGQMLAKRVGKAAELEQLAREVEEAVLRGPPQKAPRKVPLTVDEANPPPPPPPPEGLSTGRGDDHGI